MIRMARHTAIRLGRADEAQDLLEYALLVALIALVAMGAVSTVGTTVRTIFWDVISRAANGI